MADELTLKEALDHARAFHTRMVKPFEKLPAVIEAAYQADLKLTAAQTALDSLTVRIADATAAAARAEHEASEAKRGSVEVIGQANAQANAATSAGRKTAQEWQERNASLEMAWHTREGELRAAHEALVKDFGEAIATQQKTLTALEREHAAFLKRVGA